MAQRKLILERDDKCFTTSLLLSSELHGGTAHHTKMVEDIENAIDGNLFPDKVELTKVEKDGIVFYELCKYGFYEFIKIYREYDDFCITIDFLTSFNVALGFDPAMVE